MAQSFNEEVSHFAEYYFPLGVHTKIDILLAMMMEMRDPFILCTPLTCLLKLVELVEKRKKQKLSEHEYTQLHMHILTNHKDIMQYERYVYSFYFNTDYLLLYTFIKFS